MLPTCVGERPADDDITTAVERMLDTLRGLNGSMGARQPASGHCRTSDSASFIVDVRVSIEQQRDGFKQTVHRDGFLDERFVFPQR